MKKYTLKYNLLFDAIEYVDEFDSLSLAVEQHQIDHHINVYLYDLTIDNEKVIKDVTNFSVVPK